MNTGHVSIQYIDRSQLEPGDRSEIETGTTLGYIWLGSPWFSRSALPMSTGWNSWTQTQRSSTVSGRTVCTWTYLSASRTLRTNECQLNKAIYGLNQAASAWNKTIHQVFLRNGFKSCGADQCVYVKCSKNGFIYVCLYVDDMIIAAKTSEEIRVVKNALKNAFKMKELGPAKSSWGWRSTTTSRLEHS
ncbi:unnamed protein product [Phytophthora fragariaefolia]|uniref:Unnamed protein product n=1 Tax=Phytophthora fragariaefolia TaxID=1490495 RepID=A0A9W6XEW9_9STRA|nr:unnamed protein product [Phytophthora fragariaefolia]